MCALDGAMRGWTGHAQGPTVRNFSRAARVNETQEMEAYNLAEFSLLGGPERLGVRAGLVRRGTNTVALGLVLGGFCG
jgi:hypothetical protein